MSLTLTYLGHAGVLLEDDKHAVAIDPFLTGNPLAVKKAADIRCKHVVVTHGHDDHLGDAAAIASANKGTVYANYEITQFLAGQGVATEAGNPGGKLKTDFGWIAFTQALHSSSVDGRYLGVACGVMVHLGGQTVYHCGDTGLFGDMQILGDIYRPDIALIPIGDRYTMGPELASRAAEMIRPSIAIPIHFRTFPSLVQDASGFKPKGVDVVVLKPGESLRRA